VALPWHYRAITVPTVQTGTVGHGNATAFFLCPSDAPAPMKIPFGSLSTTQNIGSTLSTEVDISESDPPAVPTEDVPKVHQEINDFDGDRVLANSILFLQDFGWWVEISYAVPEGDIGHVFEILKARNLIIITVR